MINNTAQRSEENQVRYKLLVDKIGYNSKPTGTEAGAITNRMLQNLEEAIKEYTIEELAQEVEQGKTIITHVLSGNKKKNENGYNKADHFKEAQLFLIDIDNDEKRNNKKYCVSEPADIEYIQAVCNKYGIAPALIYESFSSRTKDPDGREFLKYHILFATDTPITERETALNITKSLQFMFSGSADVSTKDIGRLLYGTVKEEPSRIIAISEETNSAEALLSEYNRRKEEEAPALEYRNNTQSSGEFNSDIALSYISADTNRNTWLKISAAYKNTGGSLALWENWCKSGNYDKKEKLSKVWESLTDTAPNESTLIKYIKENGVSAYTEREYKEILFECYHNGEKMLPESEYAKKKREEIENMNIKIEEARADQSENSKKQEEKAPKYDFNKIRKDAAEDPKKKLPLMYSNFKAWLEYKKYFIGFNVITHEIILNGFKAKKYREAAKNQLFNNLATYLEEELRPYFNKPSLNKIEKLISAVAAGNCVNPILDMIRAAKWDKKDRIQEIYEIFQLKEEDTLSCVLIKKWLMQTICLLHNGDDGEPFTPEFILVLQGKQGTGKSRFFAHLCMLSQYYGDGLCIDTRNKDSIKQVTSKWITELGEIGSTMKKDTDSLKAFITMAVDEYREAYARASVKYPRKTSFVGTVNETEYLVDPTGSRRFATIQLGKDLIIDYETQTAKFDSLQLWAQVYELVQEEIKSGKSLSSCFRLEAKEREASEMRNAAHNKPLKYEEEIRDILYDIEKYPCVHEEITVTQFINNNPILRGCSSKQAGMVLDKLGYESKTVRSGVSTQRVRTLPRRAHSEADYLQSQITKTK